MFAAKNTFLTSSFPVPVYDASALSANEDGIPSPCTFTWSHTVAAGAYAIVCIAGGYSGGATADMGAPGGATAAAVTFGGVTLTSCGWVKCNNTDAGWLWIFSGDVSSAGAGSKTVSLTLTQAGHSFHGWGSSYTYKKVSAIGALQTGYGTGTAPSLAATSQIGHRIWGIVAESNLAFGDLSAFNQTTRQSKLNTGARPEFIGGDAAGAASVTFSGTVNNPENWCVAALDLI